MKPLLDYRDMAVASGKSPWLCNLPAIEYWETLAVVSLRRLFSKRSDPLARASVRGWIRTLRSCRAVRAYRGWLAA